MEEIRFWLAVIYRLRLFLIAIFYIVVFAFIKLKLLLYVAPFFALAAVAYALDRQREERGLDDFRGDWLFFRYGEQVGDHYFPIPVNPDWGGEQVRDFAHSLRVELAQRVRSRLHVRNVEVLDSLGVKDVGTGEGKAFLRLTVRSALGSLLTHFVHYAPFGQTITAHYFTYLRGTESLWELCKFIFVSPFTIWFWGPRWLMNQFSVTAAVSFFSGNSFDGIDVRTMHCLTNHVLACETEDILEKAGLLTEEIRKQIQIFQTNHYNNQYNDQSVKVLGSPNASVGSISQSVIAKAGKPAA